MRSSSARQQTQPEFDFGTTSEPIQEPELAPPSSPSLGIGPDLTNIEFGVAADLYAATSRRAGRLNAANIPDAEVDNLMQERQLLLDKKFDETMTRAEELRLKYIQWQLDTIDDARTGEQLDMLEAWVSRYEQFQEDLNRLHTELSKYKRGTRR